MKRIVMMAVSVILALTMAAPMVYEQGQGGAPEPVDQTIDLNAGDVFGRCDFPIRLELNGKAKTIDLPGDRFMFTSPGLKATLTNLDNGHQETLNVTGAFHQTTSENGDVETVVTGRNLLGDPEAGFVLAKGRFSFVFDENGNLVQPLSGKGKLTDVCALLA